MRCSTNFENSTDNFCASDIEIIDVVKQNCNQVFEQDVDPNHVLAQIYYNKDNRRAAIKSHSDKTKDMPINGIIAFCTFYKDIDKTKQSKFDSFDYYQDSKKTSKTKETSVLTTLHFKLKSAEDYEKEFSIKLYPNSMFVISLEMNRLYTHEIRPSCAAIDALPTRMGYIVRCSNQMAIYSDGTTFVVDEERVPLRKPTNEEMDQIRELYFIENTQNTTPNYRSVKYFSLNNGDFKEPNVYL